MRLSLFAAAIVTALVGVLVLGVSEDAAYAKGTAIGFTPEAGPAHEEVMVSGGSWPENTEVRLFATFSPVMEGSYPPADEFVGPFEVVSSNADGRWEAQITPDAIAGLGLPNEPGFLIVRAESDDLPLYLESANSNHFVLTVDGQRPAGSGQIRVSITFESEPLRSRLGGIGWRRVGSDRFSSPYSSGISLQGTLAIKGLPDGDWEVGLSFGGDLEPVPGQPIWLVHAPVCSGIEGVTCLLQPQRLFVQRVTIANAEVVSVGYLLRKRADLDMGVEMERLASPQTSVSSSDNGRAALVAGASALLAMLIAGTAVLRYRRAGR